MDIVTAASTISGLPFRVKEILSVLDKVWRRIQHITDNPKQKAELDELVNIFYGNLKSLQTDRDEAISNLILADLRSLDESLRYLQSPRGSMAWLKSTEYHERLQDIGSKLKQLITQCAHLYYSDPLASTVYYQKSNLPTCKAGLGRSEHVLAFLEKQNAAEQPRRVIVIYGQAGIGKTTLLETIWQKATSRVAPFRAQAYVQLGEALKPEVIENLQSEICHQLGKNNMKFPAFSFGQRALGELFRKMKDQKKPVFLAIDNIFKVEHLKSLLPSKLAVEDMPSSSCIAITCRDQRIGDALLRICCLEAENLSQKLFFEPRLLNSEESEELFADCAGMKLSDPGCKRLLQTFTPLGGGLPLALRVLGSIFRDKKRREPREWSRIRHQWATFDDTGDRHTSEVTNALHISYKLLHESRQWAFLDVVTSFYGWPWKLVESIVDKEKMKDLRESSLISKVESEFQCNQSALRCRSHQWVFNLTGRFYGWDSGYVWVHDLTLRFGESINNNEVNSLGHVEHCQEHQLGYVERPFISIGDLPKVINLRNLVLRISSSTSGEQLSKLLSSLQDATNLQTLIVENRGTGCSSSKMKCRLVDGSRRQKCLLSFSYTGQWGEEWDNFLKKVPVFSFKYPPFLGMRVTPCARTNCVFGNCNLK